MSLCKEILLSCILMTHISATTSQPVRPVELQRNLKDLGISLCYLHIVEEDYINLMFDGYSPKGYQLDPIEGITWPAGNTTEEIQTSICAITDYLENHLPIIISTLTDNPNRLIKNIMTFTTQFKTAVIRSRNNSNSSIHCHRDVTSDDYKKKITGLRIISFTRKWVEHFANKTCM